NGSGTAQTSALGVASANGYTNNGTSSSVTVNIPPVVSTNFSGLAGYAEGIVTWNQQRGFSGVFGSGTVPVRAPAGGQGRSVSGVSTMPGILLLGKSGTTLSVGGNGTVSVTDPVGYTGNGGSIYINSTGPNAVSQQGNHAEATAPSAFLAQTGSVPSG